MSMQAINWQQQLYLMRAACASFACPVWVQAARQSCDLHMCTVNCVSEPSRSIVNRGCIWFSRPSTVHTHTAVVRSDQHISYCEAPRKVVMQMHACCSCRRALNTRLQPEQLSCSVTGLTMLNMLNADAHAATGQGSGPGRQTDMDL